MAHDPELQAALAMDQGSIETARKRAADAGVSDRVRCEVAHCHGYPAAGYDLIMFLAAFHDLGDPVGAAAYARNTLGEGGALMLVEMQAADDLAENPANPAAGGYEQVHRVAESMFNFVLEAKP